MIDLIQRGVVFVAKFQSINWMPDRRFANLLQTILIGCFVMASFALGGEVLSRRAAPLWLAANRCGRWRRLPLVMGLLTFLGAAIVARAYPPVPYIHDEHSNLLAAETFASGRLTNPPHPLAEHFATFHVNVTPTYQSKYLPGQGLLLAPGLLLGESPLIGTWVAAAACVAVLVWMLQGMVEPELAFVGGLVAWSQLVFSYWTQSYFGASIVALGGVSTLAAALRLPREPSVKWALTLGVGVSLLALSRPYEGAFLTAIVGVYLLAALFRRADWERRRDLFVHVILPASGVVVGSLAWLLYYNFRVCGSPWTFPYQIYDAAYIPDPVLLFEHSHHVDIANPVIREFMTQKMPSILRYHEQLQSVWGFAAAAWCKIWDMGQFFLGPALFIPFAMALLTRTDTTTTRLMKVLFAAMIVVGLSTTYWLPHYSSAFYGAVVVIVVLGLKRISQARSTKYLSTSALAATSVIACVATNMYVGALGLSSSARRKLAAEATEVKARLEAKPGPRVVFVRGEVGVILSLVYNPPDPDRASTVWVWDLGREKNQAVLKYYADRYSYLVEATETHEHGHKKPLIQIRKYNPDAEPDGGVIAPRRSREADDPSLDGESASDPHRDHAVADAR